LTAKTDIIIIAVYSFIMTKTHPFNKVLNKRRELWGLFL